MNCPCCGKPKRPDIPQGLGSALKPACEPIAILRKPLSEKSIAANVLRHGTGALNIDGCRIEGQAQPFGNGTARSGGIMGESTERGPWEPTATGRWPANLCHDGSDEVVAWFPESDSKGGGGSPASGFWGNAGGCDGQVRNDAGSAARFFYTAKASSEERGEGNGHPTVKPVSLMRWLVRLVTPKGGTVLDPFAGSGSTLIAADAEQFNAIGIELSPEYVAIAERRVKDAAGMFADVKVAA